MTTTSTGPDLALVKARQQQTWASEHYTVVSSSPLGGVPYRFDQAPSVTG